MTGQNAGHDWAMQQPSPRWMWGIVAVGVGLRLAQYLSGRSLWYDEALLALNILHRSLSGLLKPLDFHQGAPVGFLLLEKLVTRTLGNSELALRLIPFVAGLAALFLFWRVAKLCLPAKAVPLALALFALCDPLIYYSSEVKQYSSDVAITLGLLWTCLEMARSRLSAGPILWFSVLGTVAIWFAHPASFLLAGAGATLTMRALMKREWARLGQLALVSAAWGLSFYGCYVVSLRGLSRNPVLLDYWRDYFVPHPLWSWSNLLWLFDRFMAAFEDPAGLTPLLGAAVFVAGCVALFRRDRLILAMLVAPIAVMVLASGLGRYPLAGRLVLFTAPLLLLLVAEGTLWIGGAARSLAPATPILLIAFLLAQPVLGVARRLARPLYPDNIKPAIQYIREHERPGDEWYLYHYAKYQFWYYTELNPVGQQKVRIGAECGSKWECYTEDLDQLRGAPRVWVLLSHIMIEAGTDEETLVLEHLDRMGKRLDAYKSTGARAYLYDLSGNK